jgi:hypothetical protein
MIRRKVSLQQKEGFMKAQRILSAVVCFLAGAALALAADPQMGSWKLNEGKSKTDPTIGKNTMVVYAAAGDNVKVTIDGVDKDGKPTHNEWTGKIDGKDYPVTGDAGSDSRSYKKVDDRTMAFVVKKGGKTTITGTVAISADGKNRTVNAAGTDAGGKAVTSTLVYDKQ